jgi:hypothetical protein
MFVIGGGVAGDLRMSVDFRSVYASVLAQRLNVPSASLLEGSFPASPLFGQAIAAPGTRLSAAAQRRSGPEPAM